MDHPLFFVVSQHLMIGAFVAYHQPPVQRDTSSYRILSGPCRFGRLSCSFISDVFSNWFIHFHRLFAFESRRVLVEVVMVVVVMVEGIHCHRMDMSRTGIEERIA